MFSITILNKMAMNMFGDEVVNDFNVQNDLDVDGDLNVDGDAVIVGDLTVSGTINGATNRIEDADATTSITTEATAETLIFTTNSSEAMRIENNGEVGIGTNSPDTLLHLRSSATLGTQIRLQPNDFNDRAIISFYENDGALMFSMGAREDSSDLRFSNSSADPTADANPVLSLGSDDNVGIGIADAVSNLQVNDTGTAGIIQLTNTSTGATASDGTVIGLTSSNFFINNQESAEMNISTGGEMNLRTNNTDRITIESGGDVGIGTNAPDVKLHVEDGGITSSQDIVRYIAPNLNSGSEVRLKLGQDDSGGDLAEFNFRWIANNDVDNRLNIGFNANPVLSILNNDCVGLNNQAPGKILSVVNSSGTGQLEVRSSAESNDTFLFLGTPFDGSAVNKVALIADAASSFSRSDLHFCLNDTANNSTEVSLSDSKMTILRGGNVGIANTVPTALLHIGDEDNTDLIRLDTERGWVLRSFGTGSGTGLELSNEVGYGKTFKITEDSSSNIALSVLPNATATSQRVFLCESGGMVGIGTNSPSYELSFNDGDTGFENSATGQLDLSLNNTKVMEWAVANENRYYNNSLAAVASRNFRKNATASSSNVFEAFYRSATSTSSGTFEGSIRLDGSGNLVIDNTSDVRLKENIVEYINGYQKVKDLRIVEYDWKDPQKKLECGRVVGVIAQEVQEVLPKSIGSCKLNETDETEYLTVAYSEMIPFNWSATRQLITKMESLEARVAQLEADKITQDATNQTLLDLVSALNDRITALENPI